MSRYFISPSRPRGPAALTLFNVALLCSPPLSPCLLHLCPRPLLAGWVYAAGPAPPVGLTGARAPSEVIDYNQQLGRLELSDAVDFKRWSAHTVCCCFGFYGAGQKSDKHTNVIL